MEDSRMSIQTIEETSIQDGKGGTAVVKPGDPVWLSLEGNTESMRGFCEGSEPYTIKWIGRWPCGGVNLYLAGRGEGAGKGNFQSSARE